MSAARQSLFQRLKPACVGLGETALKFRAGDVSGQRLCSALSNLHNILSNLDRSDQVALDARVAEYVFFPVSHIFRERSSVPAEALELACRCLRALLRTGWRSGIAAELGHQLMILLTFLADGSAQSAETSVSVTNASEEVQSLAFECEALVFTSVGKAEAQREVFLGTEKIPAIGHAVSVILESIKASTSIEVGVSAVAAIQAFLDSIASKEVAASFLPGIVSAFSHVLTPTTQMRRPYRLLVSALSVLHKVLLVVFPASPSRRAVEPRADNNQSELVPQLDEAWFKANASQVRLSLAGTVKLSKHDRREVRTALADLCLDVLANCSAKLSEAVEMLLDTAILLASLEDQSPLIERLQSLILGNEQLHDALSSITYDWLVSLPRVMLSNDDSKKEEVVSKLVVGYNLLTEFGGETPYLDTVAFAHLRDGLSSALAAEAAPRNSIEPTTELSLNTVAIGSGDQDSLSTEFRSIVSRNERVQYSVNQLERLILTIGSSATAVGLAKQALDSARGCDGNERLASFWVGIQLLSVTVNKNEADSELIDFGFESSEFTIILDEAFSFSLATLNEDEDSDWRLKALSLEAIALNARARKSEFRDEFVDVLYTVVQLMGSPVEPLRNHAITCLNSISQSCGYKNAKDLLVSNADYLVNAIGLRIDSFDLSPQVSQVLSMTISLAGPSIVPYLDDVVESIFSALDCFHGYPLLTEVLFTSLNAVVHEGVKTPALAIEQSNPASHRKTRVGPPSASEVAEYVKTQAKKAQDRIDAKDTPVEVPQKPWAELREKNEEDTPSEEVDEDEQQQEKEQESKTSRTYELVKRIVVLTQHHLPSSSPSLRMSLLSLLATALPYLAFHEDSFLPLVHTLWPVLVPRLEDDEAYVVAGVLRVLSAMCVGAGDFMSSRIQGLWTSIRRLYKLTQSETWTSHSDLAHHPKTITKDPTQKSKAGNSETSRNEDLLLPSSTTRSNLLIVRTETGKETPDQVPYQATTTKLLRHSLTDFLVHLLSYVRLSDAMVNEITNGMLNESMQNVENVEVRDAIKNRNPDAFWLAIELARSKTSNSGIWSKHKPLDVDGAPKFVRVAF